MRISLSVLLILLVVTGLAACQVPQTSAPSTPTPTYVPLYSHTPSYSGVYLNTEPTPFGGNMSYKVVQSLQDIPRSDIVLLDRQADHVVFVCNQNYHTGSPVGSIDTYRLCGMRLDASEQRLLAMNAINSVASPDRQWVLFGGTLNKPLCCNCDMNLYAMRPDGSNLMNLTSTPSFANLRRCGIGNIEWKESKGNVEIRFKAWSGRQDDFPMYSILFRATL